jgi:hypothetical protein
MLLSESALWNTPQGKAVAVSSSASSCEPERFAAIEYQRE